MARTKKTPTLAELLAQRAAMEAKHQEKMAADQAKFANERKAIDAAIKAEQVRKDEQRKGDLQHWANKVGALVIKLGLADKLYDNELTLADIEAALKGISAAPVSVVAPVLVSPADQGPEVLEPVIVANA